MIFVRSGTGFKSLSAAFLQAGEIAPIPSVEILQRPDPKQDKFIPFQDRDLDLQFKGMVIFNGPALPGYTAMAGGVYVFGARTGGLNENQDLHYKRLASSYTRVQPTLNAIYADFHGALWKVLFRQNRPERYYDPNWFSYGPGGVLNTDNPNIGGDVHNGFDLK